MLAAVASFTGAERLSVRLATMNLSWATPRRLRFMTFAAVWTAVGLAAYLFSG
jgi:hypothetical protein